MNKAQQATEKELSRLIELTKRHVQVMKTKDILVCVYTIASGFLWSMSNMGGTDLGWSDFNGNCKNSGTFIKYEDAFEDALNLIDKCDLDKFREETPTGFHWGNYSSHLNRNYR